MVNPNDRAEMFKQFKTFREQEYQRFNEASRAHEQEREADRAAYEQRIEEAEQNVINSLIEEVNK